MRTASAFLHHTNTPTLYGAAEYWPFILQLPCRSQLCSLGNKARTLTGKKNLQPWTKLEYFVWCMSSKRDKQLAL